MKITRISFSKSKKVGDSANLLLLEVTAEVGDGDYVLDWAVEAAGLAVLLSGVVTALSKSNKVPRAFVGKRPLKQVNCFTIS